MNNKKERNTKADITNLKNKKESINMKDLKNLLNSKSLKVEEVRGTVIISSKETQTYTTLKKKNYELLEMKKLPNTIITNNKISSFTKEYENIGYTRIKNSNKKARALADEWNPKEINAYGVNKFLY